jgi:type VI secretion system secreted protein VgrG
MSLPIYQSLKHSAYRLVIRDDEALFLDVLSFQGEEHLSQTFKYSIEFTCEEQDLDPKRVEVGTSGQVLVKAPTFDYRIVSAKLDLAVMAIPPNTHHAPETSSRQSYSG